MIDYKKLAEENTGDYFDFRATVALADEGFPNADSTELAAWARKTRKIEDRRLRERLGAIVTTDGEVVGEVIRQGTSWTPTAYYLTDETRERYNSLGGNVVPGALGAIKRVHGRDVFVVHSGDVCRGAGRGTYINR